MFVTFIIIRHLFKSWTIEILVLTSWIPASKNFFKEVILKEIMSEDSSLSSWQTFVHKFNGKVDNSSKTFIWMSLACTLIKVSTIATLSLLSVHHIIMGPWSSYLRNNTVIRQNKVKTTGQTNLNF